MLISNKTPYLITTYVRIKQYEKVLIFLTFFVTLFIHVDNGLMSMIGQLDMVPNCAGTVGR